MFSPQPRSWATDRAAQHWDLRLGSFKTVGLVIPDLHNPVYTTFADLLEQRMRGSTATT